jgi:hypothetical protein
MLTHSDVLCRKLPAEPFLRQLRMLGGLDGALGARGIHVTSREGDRFEAALRRARRRGWILASSADALCCELLGMHPAQVYGDDWWANDLDAHREAS